VLPSGQKTWRYRAITPARRIPVTPARERRRVHQTSVTLNRSQLDVQTHDGEGPAGTAGGGAAAYFKEISTGGVSPGPGLIALNLPAGAYAFRCLTRQPDARPRYQRKKESTISITIRATIAISSTSPRADCDSALSMP